jgi:hypothetical protein
MWGCELVWNASNCIEVAGCLECGNETWGFVNGESYCDQMNDCSFWRTLLCGVNFLLEIAHQNGYLKE